MTIGRSFAVSLLLLLCVVVVVVACATENAQRRE